MGNQPTKYKKFVATAATATLVASAIVPVASAAGFSDVADTNSHAENINALVEAGLINGYQDGTFKPNAELTRGHVVKMLGRWVEAQGKEIPADWNTVQRFDDVAVDAADEELVKYAALVKDAGVFNGSNGDLNAAANITRENMALVLDRAYDAIFGTSLVEKAASADTVTVADLSTAKAEAQEAIQALRNLGISNVDNFQPKNTVTRGQFASFLNRTINGGEVAPAPGAATIKSLTATAANQLTVTFDGAVNTEAAQFAVTKGSTAVTVSDVKWNEEKTQAVLTVDETFGGATYTVTVGGVAGQDLTASVTTAREQVTSIEFLSDNLVLTGKEDKTLEAGKTYKQAVITFAVYNQYGEDITDSVNESYFKDKDVNGIDVLDGEENITIEDGKFIVWVDADEDDDATGSVEFTYERNDNEISVEHDVTLSDEAEPSQVEIVGLYSPTNDELTVENLEDGDEFQILFNVKDQYGVDIDAKFADSIKSSTEDTILTQVQDGIRIDVSNDDIFEVKDEEDINIVNVDGKYYFAIEIYADDVTDVKGGENTVTFRSKATGEEASKAFTVADSDQPHSIELGLPSEVIAGDEDVLLPVSTYNKAGELINDAKALNEDVREGRVKVDLDGAAQGGYTFVEKDGKVFLKFKSADNKTDEAQDFDISIEVEESGIENELNVFVEPNAHPEKIVGLKDKALTYALINDTIKIEAEDLMIEDQYGRAYDDFSTGDAHKQYNITAKSSNKDVFTITNEGTDFEVQSQGKGNATIQFTLTGKDVKNNEINDTLDVTFRSIEADNFDSFKVVSDGLLHGTNESDDAGIEVYGLIGDLEVELTTGWEVTTESKYLNVANNKVTANTAALVGENSDNVLDDKTDRVEAGVLVTINETGETITHNLTIAREDAKVTNKFELIDNESVSKELLDSVIIDITNESSLTAEMIMNQIFAEGFFDIEDQYDNDAVELAKNEAGNPINVNVTDRQVKFTDGTSDYLELTITDIDSSKDKGVVTSNGTSKTAITLDDTTTDTQEGLEAGDSFNLTLTIDGQSQTIKVFVK